jgi:quercetin dioxygenase-like cupin family protein
VFKFSLTCLALIVVAPSAFAQATSRPCPTMLDPNQPGPACLVAQTNIGKLPGGDIYWHISEFADRNAAQAAKTLSTPIIEAFGKFWIFSIGPRTKDLSGTTQVGPLPVNSRSDDFVAEYLQSTFSPGMTAPVHVHSGPEAFYVVSGDTCLESPDGVQLAKGPGSHVIIRQGPPMLLMATGTELRRGFALILHDKTAPPTTLVHDWAPKGLCNKG